MFLPKKITKAMFAGLIICLSLSVRAQFNRQQVDHLNNKAEQWYYTPDSLLAFAKKAHQLAIESNYKNGEAIALKFLAIYEHTRGNFDVALGMYNEALIMLETVKNNFEIAKTTLSIASVYDAKNDHVNSLKYGLRSLRIFEELKDLKGQGKILNILGIVSAKQGDLKRAKTYFIQYNQISKRGTDTVSLAYSYNNLGGVNRDLRLIDSGLFYFKIAAKLFGKKRFLPGLALADKNIGAIYFDKKDFKNALHYAKKSLQNGSKSGDKKSIAVAYKEIGVCYRELKDTVSAYLSFNKALALAKTINDKEVLRDTYACLAELEDANKNYKSAYDNLQASRLAHDSLLNTEKTKVIEDLTTKYETAKKRKGNKITESGGFDS